MSRPIPSLAILWLIALGACSERPVAPSAAGGRTLSASSVASAIGGFVSPLLDPAPQPETPPAVEAHEPSAMGQLNTLGGSNASQASGQSDTVPTFAAVGDRPPASAMGEKAISDGGG